MAPVFVAGASRVLAPGGLSLFKVRPDGSQFQGGFRAPTSATNPRQVFGYLRRHALNLQKAAFIVKPHLKARNLRLVFAIYSPAHSEGEPRITQRALILTSLANSAAETTGLHCPQEAEMSLSKG
jgi:hypothetical protein